MNYFIKISISSIIFLVTLFLFNSVLLADEVKMPNRVYLTPDKAVQILKGSQIKNRDWHIRSGPLVVEKDPLDLEKNVIYGVSSDFTGHKALIKCRYLDAPLDEKLVGTLTISNEGGGLYAFWETSEEKPFNLDLSRFTNIPIVDLNNNISLEICLSPLYRFESVCIVLDTSGSMKGQKFKAAIQSLNTLLNTLPSQTEIAFFWFPQCNISDQTCPSPLYLPFKSTRKGIYKRAKTLVPTGNTPLGCTLEEAFLYLHKKSRMSPERRRLVVLSDGKNTCGKDATDVIKTWPIGLKNAQNFAALGLDVSKSDSIELKKIADESGGTYIPTTLESVEKDLPSSFQLRGRDND